MSNSDNICTIYSCVEDRCASSTYFCREHAKQMGICTMTFCEEPICQESDKYCLTHDTMKDHVEEPLCSDTSPPPVEKPNKRYNNLEKHFKKPGSRCSAKKENGENCRGVSLRGTGFCQWHGPNRRISTPVAKKKKVKCSHRNAHDGPCGGHVIEGSDPPACQWHVPNRRTSRNGGVPNGVKKATTRIVRKKKRRRKTSPSPVSSIEEAIASALKQNPQMLMENPHLLVQHPELIGLLLKK